MWVQAYWNMTIFPEPGKWDRRIRISRDLGFIARSCFINKIEEHVGTNCDIYISCCYGKHHNLKQFRKERDYLVYRL